LRNPPYFRKVDCANLAKKQDFRKVESMERTTTIEWEGRSIEAADPAPIEHASFELSSRTVRATERAAATIQGSAARGGAANEVAGRLLLRAEGLSSSAIEGLRATSEAVALAEAGASTDDGGTATWVADNLAVVTDALITPPPLTVDTLLAWHRRLMRHARGMDADHVGAWRPVVGWIGGANPIVAAHVASPPDRIAPAMADLVAFLGRDDVDPVTAAAVAHAQFETVHPFADGNGRIGRVLIGWVLATRLDVAVPPPVSTAFARDIGGYLSGLTLYRQGHVDHWVRWFADAVLAAAERTERTLEAVEEVQHRWTALAADLRSDAAARRAIAVIAERPVLNASLLAEALGVSGTAARSALGTLAELSIVEPLDTIASGRGRPATWWVARDLVALLP
jgi:Fic family protein